MSGDGERMRYTVEQEDGIWYQLWWSGEECVYSEDLQSLSREEAEEEAAAIAEARSPLASVMGALGCEPRESGNDKGQ